jgi:transcriptional regulator with XRE-family HTH domain
MTSGEKVRALRRAHGISQSRLAGAARLAPYTVWRIEHGTRRPSGRSLRLLSAAFTLLTGELVRPDDLRADPC